MKLDDIEQILYEYIEGNLPADGDDMQEMSGALHNLIESVIQDVCYDNGIDYDAPW